MTNELGLVVKHLYYVIQYFAKLKTKLYEESMKKRSKSELILRPTAPRIHPGVDQDFAGSTRTFGSTSWSTRTYPVVDQGPYLVDQSFTESLFLVRFDPSWFLMSNLSFVYLC